MRQKIRFSVFLSLLCCFSISASAQDLSREEEPWFFPSEDPHLIQGVHLATMDIQKIPLILESWRPDPENRGLRDEWFLEWKSRGGWQSDLNSYFHSWDPRMIHGGKKVGVAWYKQHFFLPLMWKGSLTRVRFFGVNLIADVWVNEKYVGYHQGGFTPFSLDITKFVKYGEDNVLVVRVDNERKLERIPGPDFPWYPWGGIIREIIVEKTPPVRLTGLFITPDFSKETAAARVDYRFSNTLGSPRKADVTITISAPDGHTFETGASHRLNPEGESTFSNTIDVGKARLWSPSHPSLYRAKIRWKLDGAKRWTEETRTFGMRAISCGKDGISVNGERIFLKGIGLREARPGLRSRFLMYHIRSELEQIKSTGANFVRLAYHPHHPYALKVCDEIGLAAVVEMPLWGKMPSESCLESWYLPQLSEAVNQCYNNPSCIALSLGSELDKPPPQRIIERARELAGNRLITYSLDPKASSPAAPRVDFLSVPMPVEQAALPETSRSLIRSGEEGKILLTLLPNAPDDGLYAGVLEKAFKRIRGAWDRLLGIVVMPGAKPGETPERTRRFWKTMAERYGGAGERAASPRVLKYLREAEAVEKDDTAAAVDKYEAALTEMLKQPERATTHRRIVDIRRKIFRLKKLMDASEAVGKKPTSPTSSPDTIRVVEGLEEKEEGVYRIFFFGGSTVYGWPLQHSFPELVRVIIHSLLPHRTVEVYNAGEPGWHLNAVSDKIKTAVELDFQMDMIILYSGNNEFLELHRHQFLEPLQPGAMHNDLETYYGIFKNGARGDEAIAVKQRLFTRGLKNYEAVLRKLADYCRRKNIQLVLCTVAVNIEWPPPSSLYASLSEEDEAERRHKSAEAEALSKKMIGSRVAELFLQALEKDGTPAILHFKLAEIYKRMRKYDKAKKEFLRAVEMDGEIGRILPLQNDIIRKVSSEEGVPLIDVEKLFEAVSPHGITGNNLFVDNCHPTLEAHFLIAKEICRRFSEEGLIAPPGEWRWADEKGIKDYFLDLGLTTAAIVEGYRIGGMRNIEYGMPQKAEELFKRSLALVPDDLTTLIHLADCYILEGKLPEARELCDYISSRYLTDARRKEVERLNQKLNLKMKKQ